MVRDALRQARELLSSVKSPDASQGSGAAERVLECAFRLLESVYATIDRGESMTLSSSDSTVVKAILELVVRWGIYPHLSPGVGIPLEKRFGEKSAASAAAALQEHVSGGGSGSSVDLQKTSAKSSDSAPTSLLQSAELLAGLILDSPQKQSLEPSDVDLQPSVSQSYNPVEKGGEAVKEETIFPAAAPAALHQLVLFHHLPDLCAAFLQLAVSGKEEWKLLATGRMNEMVRALPVAHMVEALLTLLGQRKPDPPTWLKERAGRMLSKLLLREGGVAASMERLVGGIQEGNVKAYEHIASHLAKVPKYITTTQAYYEVICPQLPPLFLAPLPGQEGGLKEGTSAARLVVNMHHTAIIMACKLASRDIRLCGEYLFTPLLRPLVRWGMQTQAERKCELTKSDVPEDSSSEGTSVNEGHSESEEEMESALVNALIATHIFLTAGHDGADSVREVLVRHMEPITEALVALKILLEHKPKQVKQVPSHSTAQVQGSAGRASSSERETTSKTTKPAFGKGFLENLSLGYATAEGPSSIIDRVRAALSDIVDVLHEEQPVPKSVPTSSVINAVRLEWPRNDGEIWTALNSDR